MFRKLILITFGLALYSTEVVAGSCPMDYLKRYEDGRNSKVAEHWVISIDRNDLRILEKENSLSTYNRITKERPSDFKCTFKDSTGGLYKIGKCTNSAGFSWDPNDQGKGYRIDEQGSYSYTTNSCIDNLCIIFVDKSGNRFLARGGIKRSIYDSMYEGYGYNDCLRDRANGRFELECQSNSTYHVIKDGTSDLQIDVVIKHFLFGAGNKVYITIGRETESGLYCTYKGGVAPNI